jgi:hypothetical protein
MPNPQNRKITGGAAAKVYLIGSDAGALAVTFEEVPEVEIAGQPIDVNVLNVPFAVNVLTLPALPAGENHIGEVSGNDLTIEQRPTVTAGAYAAGDTVGGLLTFANAERVAGDGGIIKNMLIIDDAGQDVEMELWLFNTTITPIADNAPWAPAEADLENLVAVISTAAETWRAAGTPSAIDVELSKGYNTVDGALYGQLMTRGAPTFAATDDVTVKIHVMRN